jgi:CRP/FNR family cyclic AMP-dependent transcriptional regulator
METALVEVFGYLASALVLATFTMRTMVPLRLVAMGSNVAFIVYAALGGLYPVLLLHAILLPLNLYRFLELRRLLDRVRTAAHTDLSLDWLHPFMKSVELRAGAVLFRKGDEADRLYVVLSGTIELAEIGVRLGPGEILGEVGMFSRERRRTQTAVCDGAAELLWIDELELKQLCHQQPAMAFYLLRLVTARLTENLSRADAASSGPVGGARTGS